MIKENIASQFKGIQEEICRELETLEKEARFQSDVWSRTEGGGGDTRVIQNGALLEKGGVNFSAVYGPVSPQMAHSFAFPNGEFYATGVSIVIHPRSPFMPIIHMNIRYFELSGHSWWFGGGIDLTPIYVDEAEARTFHSTLKGVCDAYDHSYYPKFKQWADDYFYLPHRKETRGIGGIFFDRLTGTDSEKGKLFDFVAAVGKSFAPLYTSILRAKAGMPYSEKHIYWQSLRRSRYVEFNLVYDKGTKFGLESDGRVESILMSMPPMAQWPYNYQPEEGSREQETLAKLKKGKAWV